MTDDTPLKPTRENILDKLVDMVESDEKNVETLTFYRNINTIILVKLYSGRKTIVS